MVKKFFHVILMVAALYSTSKPIKKNSVLIIGTTSDFYQTEYPQVFVPFLEFDLNKNKFIPYDYTSKKIEKIYSLTTDEENIVISEAKFDENHFFAGKEKYYNIKEKKKEGIYLSKNIKIKNYIDDNDIKMKFYALISEDVWGKQYFRGIPLDQVLENEHKLGFKIVYISDLNKDDNYEFWIYFVTMYDDRIYDIYEVSGNTLIELASSCPDCS